MEAGAFSERVRFERLSAASADAYGNVFGGSWAALVTCWAAFRPQFGRESLEAGRLESTLSGVVRVRRFAATESVTAEDRVVFVAGPYAGRTANIRSIVPTMDNRAIEMTIEEGVAA